MMPVHRSIHLHSWDRTLPWHWALIPGSRAGLPCEHHRSRRPRSRTLLQQQPCLFTLKNGRAECCYISVDVFPNLGIHTALQLRRLQIASQNFLLLKAETYDNFGSGEAEREAYSKNPRRTYSLRGAGQTLRLSSSSPRVSPRCERP